MEYGSPNTPGGLWARKLIGWDQARRAGAENMPDFPDPSTYGEGGVDLRVVEELLRTLYGAKDAPTSSGAGRKAYFAALLASRQQPPPSVPTPIPPTPTPGLDAGGNRPLPGGWTEDQYRRIVGGN
jgi:hypothetical protein